VNAWTHLAISFDGSTKRLYVNGGLVASQGGLGPLIYEPASPPGAVPPPVTIGADWGHDAPVDIFSGRIDEVSIYRRALLADEIFGLADAGPAGKAAVGPYITSPSQLPFAVVGQRFSSSFTSVRGTGAVVYALSTASRLPPGLALSSAGAASGVPSKAGSFGFVVRATDAAGLFSEQSCRLQVFESIRAPAGLVGWWRAEGDARDSAGANHGTLYDGAGFTAGEVGQGFSFDGAAGFVEIADAPALRPASVTVEAWVAFDATSGVRCIFVKLVDTGINTSYSLWLENGMLRGAAGDAAGRGPVLSYNFSPAPGHWYHTAYTFDDGARQQALYLNGVQVVTGPVTKPIGYDAQPLILGRGRINGTPNFFMQGRIDEAAVYNRALSWPEIFSIYHAGPAGKQLN
jgi:Concanavalin A-like lectin/glucanases superfamily/Putative Ig domain